MKLDWFLMTVATLAVTAILSFHCFDQTAMGSTSKGNRDRDVSAIRKIIIHTFGPEVDGLKITDAATAAKVFDMKKPFQAGSYTSGKAAYHFLYELRTGKVFQALNLGKIGVHARGYNEESVAIAILADEGELAQCSWPWMEFMEFVAKMRSALEEATTHEIEVYGHMELPGASHDPLKECPAHDVDMDGLRQFVYKTGQFVLETPGCVKEDYCATK